MMAYGRVENGVVQLQEHRFTEGQQVVVLPLGRSPAITSQHPIAPHRFMEIAPISLGNVLHSFDSDDDVLGEMLEDRR